MTIWINFHVPGIPAAQGSKRHLGNGVMVESSKRVKPWRTDVRQAAIDHCPEPITGPVALDLEFRFPRPKSHHGTGRNANQLKPSAPRAHTQKPDLDKLARAIGDALAGIAYRDDSQIIQTLARKAWEDDSWPAGVHITIAEVGA